MGTTSGEDGVMKGIAASIVAIIRNYGGFMCRVAEGPMIFHRHRWEITMQRFTPPYEEGTAERVSERVLRELMLGVTITCLQCTRCRTIDVRHDAGDIRLREKIR